ncbi:hypothetical protein HEP86_01650 [Streptomyces sp. RPA4-5]|uniref:hypothetical protein n=1 Tax=Streptomyces sp. RPA4-5 TaxID=2721245 RepID=UPI00143E5795|nr:hypothetical protein [Streptomyces sp. RPA4-5]QIY53158.1 hypothetical protein HEP86_01650 [Streptomyces sp. RPA4-5]
MAGEGSSVASGPFHPALCTAPARIADSSPVWLEFFVSPPPSWDETLAERAQYHFELFDLSRLYAVQANRTLNNIRGLLTTLLNSGGTQQVRAYLEGEAATRLAHRPNSWEGVTYRTLAREECFCNGTLPF